MIRNAECDDKIKEVIPCDHIMKVLASSTLGNYATCPVVTVDEWRKWVCQSNGKVGKRKEEWTYMWKQCMIIMCDNGNINDY